MNLIQRITGFVLAGVVMVTSTGVYANDQDRLNREQQQLQQNMQQNAQKKKEIEQQMQDTQKNIEKSDQEIAAKDKEIAALQDKVNKTKQLMEQKKEEIVVLENKVLNRKGVMKKRMVSMQKTDNSSIIVQILINSENLADLLEKMNAVATILNADKNILIMQKRDLEKIERDKQIIDQNEKIQEKELAEQAKKKQELAAEKQKKREALIALEAKNKELIALIQTDAAKNNAIETAKQLAAQLARLQQENTPAAPVATASTNEKPPVGGKAFYVEATSYSAEGSIRLGEFGTRGGTNFRTNPNARVISVDPAVIPLGKHVWVEGYGPALADDTGGAIIGNRIDVLFPTEAQSRAWGRKIVKVIILD